MNNFEAIIFDTDGTLVDNIPYHRKAWIRFLANYGIQLVENEFDAQNHGTIDEMIVRFFGNKLSKERVKELGEEKEKTYRDLFKNYIEEIEGLSNLLVGLKKQNLKSSVATMGDKNNINFILDSLSIRGFFHSITGGHEVSRGKPDPEIFELSLKKLNRKSDKVIVIEDSIGGIKAARAAGLSVIGISTSYDAEELLSNGCFRVISNFIEITLE